MGKTFTVEVPDDLEKCLSEVVKRGFFNSEEEALIKTSWSVLSRYRSLEQNKGRMKKLTDEEKDKILKKARDGKPHFKDLREAMTFSRGEEYWRE